MALLSKFDGIVVRMDHVPMVGPRFTVLYRDCEMVVGLWPMRIIQGEAPVSIRSKVLQWAGDHESELVGAWFRVRTRRVPLPVPPAR